MARGPKIVVRLRERVKGRFGHLPATMNRIHPPGMRGAGLYDVLFFFFNGLRNPRFNLSAMAMAYRFFFAMFPALILLFTLIPYIPVPNLREEVLVFMGSVVPDDSLGFIYHVVDEFFNRPSAGVIYLNVLLMLFSAMSGIRVMMQAFSKEHEAFRRRNFLRANGVALMIFVTLLLIFAVMLTLLISGEYFIQDLQQRGVVSQDGFRAALLRILYWLILLFAMQVAVSVVYFFGPSMHRRWSFFSPGSMLSGVLILLAITIFRIFFVHFANYNKIYGSLGAIMVMMVWFYWISIVLLIGFELNAAIDRAHLKGQTLAEQAPPIDENAENETETPEKE